MYKTKPNGKQRVEKFRELLQPATDFARKGLSEHFKDAELENQVELFVFEFVEREAKESFWFFIVVVLQWKGLDEDFHYELAEFMENKGDSKLVLCPRGHLKSTICTVAYPLWRALREPNTRVLLANYKLDNAKSFLLQIRQELTNNQVIAGVYRNVIPDTKKVRWNETSITLVRNSNPKEATFEVTGVGGEITGRHYDVILFDDIVGPENVGTLEQLNKLRNWWNQMQAILEPGGDQILVGTRWHFADLYGYIIDNLANQFQIFHRSVYREDGSPLWEKKFKKEVLQRIEDRMTTDPKQGRALWVAQYLNQVIDEATASFKRAKMKHFEDKDLPSALGISITVDPAISDKQSADRSAITVRGVDEKNNWYVLEVWAARGVEPNDLISKIFEIYDKWNAKWPVQSLAVEAIAYQKSLIFALNDAMAKRNTYLPLVEISSHRQSKELRIKSLIPRYNMGAIFFRKPLDAGDQTDILLDEMFRFPKSEHDDCLDALVMHNELFVSPGMLPENHVDPDAGDGERDRYGYKIERRMGSSQGRFM